MIRAGIVGGTGYTGVELLRLLVRHDQVEIVAVTSREMAGTPVSQHFPNLRGHLQLAFSAPDTKLLEDCDVVFYATPHAVAMHTAPALLKAGVRVVDLSADFRIQDIAVWEQWYKTAHACPELVAEAVYGLPEVNREAIRSARLVAVPGCYPTAIQLGFLPLLEKNLVDSTRLIADAKSGVSGAGRKAAAEFLLCEASETIRAYGVAGHRHHPEICQGLRNAVSARVGLTFIPHLTPMIRGILATLYAPLADGVTISPDELQATFEARYALEPFVDVLPAGELPSTRAVKGSNQCALAVTYSSDTNTVVVLAAEDNLVKGAAGQAIQDMNLMFGLDETMGLNVVALSP